jgi:hypothetical protein
MGAFVSKLDKGFITGGRMWFPEPQYSLVDSITMQNAYDCVNFPMAKMKSLTAEGHPIDGSWYLARSDTFPPTVVAANLGDRYELTDRRTILNSLDENLLALFPQLRVAAVGTMSSGRTFFLQLVAESYHVRGDESDHELRLCYSETYGLTAHEVYCTHVRIVCQNTLRAAREEAAARGLIEKVRHTRNAQIAIEGVAEKLAEIRLGLRKDIRAMEQLAATPCFPSTLRTFLDRFIPIPEETKADEPSNAISRNRAIRDRQTVEELWETERNTMSGKVAQSRYGLLEAYLDYIDHSSYSRSAGDRWLDSLNGERANRKAEATQWLLKAA